MTDAEMPQSSLFHYTSQEGLKGIIESTNIYASHIRFLNDAAEYDYAYKVLLSQAEKYKEFFKCTLEIPPDIFVCSFSTEGDILSQWRAYCSDSSGFSIGFRTSTLQNLAIKQGFKLIKCVYEPEEHRIIINQKLSKYIALLDNLTKTDHTTILKNFMIDFYETASIIKHPSFREEKEWRLIYIGDKSELKEQTFRKGKNYLIPFKNFKLKIDKYNFPPFDEVFVGPYHHSDLSALALSSYFQAMGFPGALSIIGHGIKYSNCPLR